MIRIKEEETMKRHVVLVKKNTPLLLFVFAKNTNKQYPDAKHTFLDQNICNKFTHEQMNQSYAMGAFVQNATHKIVQAPIQKMNTTIEFIVKNYTKAYIICAIWCRGAQTVGKRIEFILNCFE